VLFGDERSLVHEYAFGAGRLPVITDLAPGTTCSRILPPATPELYPGFDVILWGAKDSDQHWVKGTAQFPPDGTLLGTAKLYAPLRHLTDHEVLDALASLGITYEPQPDALPMCTACMETTGEVWCPELQRSIPAEKVDSAALLTDLRNRFNLEVVHG
jgi:hypothetical protein